MNICPECNHPHKADYGCTALLMGSYPARPCGCIIEPGDYRPCGHPAAYIHHDQDGTAAMTDEHGEIYDGTTSISAAKLTIMELGKWHLQTL